MGFVKQSHFLPLPTPISWSFCQPVFTAATTSFAAPNNININNNSSDLKYQESHEDYGICHKIIVGVLGELVIQQINYPPPMSNKFSNVNTVRW